jgi:hypothetical protein
MINHRIEGKAEMAIEEILLHNKVNFILKNILEEGVKLLIRLARFQKILFELQFFLKLTQRNKKY